MQLHYYNYHFNKLNGRKRGIINKVKERKYKQLKYMFECDMTEDIVYSVVWGSLQDERYIKKRLKGEKYSRVWYYNKDKRGKRFKWSLGWLKKTILKPYKAKWVNNTIILPNGYTIKVIRWNKSCSECAYKSFTKLFGYNAEQTFGLIKTKDFKC